MPKNGICRIDATTKWPCRFHHLKSDATRLAENGHRMLSKMSSDRFGKHGKFCAGLPSQQFILLMWHDDWVYWFGKMARFKGPMTSHHLSYSCWCWVGDSIVGDCVGYVAQRDAATWHLSATKNLLKFGMHLVGIEHWTSFQQTFAITIGLWVSLVKRTHHICN